MDRLMGLRLTYAFDYDRRSGADLLDNDAAVGGEDGVELDAV